MLKLCFSSREEIESNQAIEKVSISGISAIFNPRNIFESLILEKKSTNSYSDHNNLIQYWSKIWLLNDYTRKKNFKIDHILCLIIRWALKKKKKKIAGVAV